MWEGYPWSLFSFASRVVNCAAERAAAALLRVSAVECSPRNRLCWWQQHCCYYEHRRLCVGSGNIRCGTLPSCSSRYSPEGRSWQAFWLAQVHAVVRSAKVHSWYAMGLRWKQTPQTIHSPFLLRVAPQSLIEALLKSPAEMGSDNLNPYCSAV